MSGRGNYPLCEGGGRPRGTRRIPPLGARVEIPMGVRAFAAEDTIDWR